MSKINTATARASCVHIWLARIAAISTIVVGPAAASPGELDASFNGTGVVNLGVHFNTRYASSLLISPAGNATVILSGDGAGGEFQLMRVTASGALDASFGNGGSVSTSFGPTGASAQAGFLQADGNIVVAGIAPATGDPVPIILIRYRNDGAVDATFNQGAPVSTNAHANFVSSVNEQPDGEILVTAFLAQQVALGDVLRYNADGTLDERFGIIGHWWVPGLNYLLPYATAFAAGGKIIVVGGLRPAGGQNETSTVAVTRLYPDGNLDTDYGAEGLVTVPFGGSAFATDVVVLPDGGTLVAGVVRDQTGSFSERYKLWLLRLRSDGTLNTAFGSGGKTLSAYGDYVDVVRIDPWPSPRATVLIEPDGKFLLVGQIHDAGVMHVVALRYNDDGSPDTTFGQSGQLIGASAVYSGHAAVVTGDRKLMIAGSGSEESGPFLVERHLLVGDATTTTLGSSMNPSPSGQPVSFSATVASGVTGGTVAFLDGGGAIAGCEAVAPVITGGSAVVTCATGPLSVGTHPIMAYFSGDGHRPASGSAQLLQTVSEPGTDTAIEYYHVGFDHYFMTSIPEEVASLDAGAFAGWSRTGHLFPVYLPGAPNTALMCRFFSGTAFAPLSSHFYTPFDFECAIVKQDPNWIFETDVMAVQLPDSMGACPAMTSPLYRLYNNGEGGAPDHRYTTDGAVRDSMLSQGWIAEGAGTIGVTACVPN